MFEQFASELGQVLNLDGLQWSVDGTMTLNVNSKHELVLERIEEHRRVLLYGVIGILPSDGDTKLMRALLDANLTLHVIHDCHLTTDRDSGEILLFRCFREADLKLDSFTEHLEQFVETYVEWADGMEADPLFLVRKRGAA